MVPKSTKLAVPTTSTRGSKSQPKVRCSKKALTLVLNPFLYNSQKQHEPIRIWREGIFPTILTSVFLTSVLHQTIESIPQLNEGDFTIANSKRRYVMQLITMFK